MLGGSLADLVILPVQTDAGEVWAAIDAASLDISALESLDLTRPVARVRAGRAAVPADRLLTGLNRAAVTSLAAILFGAEASGIADWATRAASEYAKIRHQFGLPIGQFQAVKHRCARMLTEAEQAAAAVWDAARAEPGEQREFAAAVAAVVALDAAVWCAHQCIQVLGGIGYTWEHEAHLYYRRAMSLRALLGPSGDWAEHVADLALSGVSLPVQVELPGGDAELRAQIREELSEIAKLTGRDRQERIADGGWVVPHLPGPWGRDAGALEQVVIAQEMRAAGVRGPVLAIGAWVVPALVQYGTPEQQQRFLPPTLRGDYLWCQLFSEPGAGSDLAGLSTRAVRAEGGWKITGQKIWTSLAKEARWAICIARTDPAAPKHDGITYFLVDMSTPGVEVRPLREITGDSFFNQVFLDDVFVPDDCVVGDVNGGLAGGQDHAGQRAGVALPDLDLRVGRGRAAPGGQRGGRVVAYPGGRACLCRPRDRPAGPAGDAQAAIRHRAGRDRQRAQAARHAARAGDSGTLLRVVGSRRGAGRRRGRAGHRVRRAERRAMGPAGSDDPGANDRGRHDRYTAEHNRRADTRPAPGPGPADGLGRRKGRSQAQQSPDPPAMVTVPRVLATLAYEERHPGGADDRQ